MWNMCLLETSESQTSVEELGYQTEKYGESPGLYYEQLGEITLYNTSLGQTDREIDQIGQYTKSCKSVMSRNGNSELDRLKSF
jgi:hypothetical protein